MMKDKSLIDVQITLAREEDWPAIIAIYNQSIKTGYSTADLSPVSVESRKQWFFQHSSDNYPIYAARFGHQVVGWCSLSPHRPGRMALKNTAEISYYIAEDYQRKGIGRNLIKYAIDQCPRLRLKTLFALLLDINEASIKLLENIGFQKWGHLPNVAEIDNKECGQYIYGLRVD